MMVKVLFQFDNTPVARSTLAAALEDPTWKDAHDHPTLDVGFGMAEQDALLVLVRAMQQHGARVLVVSAEKSSAARSVTPSQSEAPTIPPAPQVDAGWSDSAKSTKTKKVLSDKQVDK
jgi:hypothetical protein